MARRQPRKGAAFPFLKLPPEIRVRIYHLTMPQHIIISTVDKSSMRSHPYHADMLSETREQPRFMFTNKLIRDETYPVFQQRLTPVIKRKFRHRRDEPPKIFLTEAEIDKIENLRLCDSNEWQDHLAVQTFIHQNLKAVHLFLQAEDYSLYQSLEYADIKSVSGPLRLSSFYSLFCESMLYRHYDASLYSTLR